MLEKTRITDIIAIGFPVVLLLSFFYIFIFDVPHAYIIDIGAKEDIDTNNIAYIQDLTTEGKLSLRMSNEGNTFRNMTGSPVYFNFTPEKEILNETDIIAELKFRGDSDLDIGVFRNYLWKPLYIKSFDAYTLARQFDDTAIYSMNEQIDYKDVDNLNEWILNNIPQYSSIRLYGISPSKFVNRNITYENADIEINQTFPGTNSFFIYINKDLNLTLQKQDLNVYNGEDIYSIELYDLDANLLFKDTFPDDGITDNSKKISSQVKRFSIESITEGLYELRLVNRKDDSNDDDSIITGLRLNTIRLITKGTTHILAPGTLYFELKHKKEISIKAGKEQTISIRGNDNKDVVIDKKLLDKWIQVKLEPGNYLVSVKGDVSISGANFAFAKDSLFQPFDYEINNESGDWIILSNYQVKKDQNGWVRARKIFKGSEFELLDNKTIVFGLAKNGNNEVAIDDFTIKTTYTGSNYMPVVWTDQIKDPASSVLDISNINAASGQSYSLDTLEAGKFCYIDRSYVFTSVPSKYIGLNYIKTANGGRYHNKANFLQFDVSKNVVVYIAYDDRISPKASWLSSFTDTGDNLVRDGSVNYSVFSRDFPAGHISLGGTSILTGGGGGTYVVIVKPVN
ncbi:MAG: hypothetical protein OIN87_07810 [Candidatus Methanoperedens sp.]|nr:hypothetical protein [Candidatus Methanoperedens sp.]